VVNQLYPCSISISPLIIIHPIALQRKLVRSIYWIPPVLIHWGICLRGILLPLSFNLMMTGSHGFGSNKFNSDRTMSSIMYSQ